jgi:hypothetical protein
MPQKFRANNPHIIVSVPDADFRLRVMQAAQERDQSVSALIRTALRRELRMGKDR